MSYHGPKVRLSRRFGIALTPKAAKVMERRSAPPGQHGKARKSESSDYKKQLDQKQLLRYQYNIRESQLRQYYEKAQHRRGNGAENLIQLLETRLDALVMRAGFAPTIYAARQIVSHQHILVNGEKVNAPSYGVQVGDVVSIKEKSRKLPLFQQLGRNEGAAYLEVNDKEYSASLIRQPQIADVPINCEVSRVIEFYSR
ncbi:MAG: 30S ribosomal protein S4 [Anaerolineales bacterium]|nr:30S ribosomal protein S4 [Anaerolineales bacterium]